MRVMVFGMAAESFDMSEGPTPEILEAFAAVDRFTETKELVAGPQIWNVKDMDEALAWAGRAPVCMRGKNHMEIRAFYEPEDLSGFVTPEELTAPRDGERSKFGVA